MDHDDGGLFEGITVEHVLLAAFIAVLAWAPLPYGSNRLWAELVLGGGLGAILLVWSGLAMTGLAAATLPLRRLAVPGACMSLALGWAFIQSVDLGPAARLIGVDLSSIAHPVWTATAHALGADAGAYVSVDPELTREAVFASALSVAAFLIAFMLGRDRDRGTALITGLVVIAAIYGAAGVAAARFDIDFQSWLMPDPKPASDRVTGPFVNPNHLATFLALSALAGLGHFVEKLRQAVAWDRGFRVFLRTLLHALTINAFWFAGVAVILGALLLTQSRGGVIAFLIGAVALIIALSVGRRWSAGEESGQRAMTALLVAILGLSAGVAADPLLGRVAEQGVTDSIRASLAQSTIEAVEAAPLIGNGFGAFERYYPLFADGTVQGYVDEAHNDVLETVADLGLPAGLAFIAAPIILAGMCFVGCLNRRRDRVFPAIAFAASAVVGVHALVEFSLQVPAVAVTYASLLGLGVAQSWRTSMDAVR